MFCQTLSSTLTMPAVTAASSRHVMPWATSQAHKAFTSARQHRNPLLTRLRHALRRRVDRRLRLRRERRLDIGHRVQRSDVVVGPGAKNLLLGRARTTVRDRRLAELELRIEAGN